MTLGPHIELCDARIHAESNLMSNLLEAIWLSRIHIFVQFYNIHNIKITNKTAG